jgi:hypothetical protein
MKGSELTRSQINRDLDPLKLINQNPEPEELQDQGDNEELKEDFFNEGNDVIRNSGFAEGMLRMNLQLDEKLRYIGMNSTQT